MIYVFCTFMSAPPNNKHTSQLDTNSYGSDQDVKITLASLGGKRWTFNSVMTGVIFLKSNQTLFQ